MTCRSQGIFCSTPLQLSAGNANWRTCPLSQIIDYVVLAHCRKRQAQHRVCSEIHDQDASANCRLSSASTRCILNDTRIGRCPMMARSSVQKHLKIPGVSCAGDQTLLHRWRLWLAGASPTEWKMLHYSLPSQPCVTYSPSHRLSVASREETLQQSQQSPFTILLPWHTLTHVSSTA